jgi:NADH:ubiquinone oxidoreductase subunit F (NADH-binding)/NADH:ubiquinone oxidoreductase subunit E
MLIDDLKDIQSAHGFLPREKLLELSRSKALPLYQIEGVASFYPHFRPSPPPAVQIAVCTDMSCWLAGAERLEREIRAEVEGRLGHAVGSTRKGVRPGSPAALVNGGRSADGRRQGGIGPSAAGREARPATDGAATGAATERSGATDAEVAGAEPSIEVRRVSCLGLCDRAPACAFGDRPVGGVTIEAVRGYLDADLDGGAPAPGGDGRQDTPRSAARERSAHVRRAAPGADATPSGSASGPAPRVDPYVGGERYGAFRALLRSGDTDAVIGALKASGLRGLGGAGFPTGSKWEFTRKAEATPRYVVCNADESEPGTFKDRDILERFPHLVLEGMLIGARVVGASRATLFLRHEYHHAEDRVREAISELAAAGLVGENVDGSGFGCELELFVSAGGYICGEETALLEALEGKRAEPRNKPPFPGVVGLHGRPTLMNNVETFAMVPGILTRGAEWFRGFGENGGSGLKYFALSGDVNRPGVYEAWLGVPARRFIEEQGGGMHGGRALKAFAPGGASSGFLPASLADLPLDFKPLAEAGSMLGTGAVVAVAEGTCMLALALNVVRFFRNESCGKCVPCREGTEELVGILERIRDGRGQSRDLSVIDELSDTMAMTSICGLGQAAPLPITSVLRHWRPEVEAHLAGRCPEGTCR